MRQNRFTKVSTRIRFGGYGSILGTTIGLFIPTTLQNGFVIIGIQPFWQQVVVGAVLIAAVYVDQRRRAAALRGGKPTMSGLLNRMTSMTRATPAQELPRTSQGRSASGRSVRGQ